MVNDDPRSSESDRVRESERSSTEVVEADVERGEVVEDLFEKEEEEKRVGVSRRIERTMMPFLEKGKGKSTHNARLSLDKHPGSQRLQRVAQPLRENVSSLELGEVVCESEVGGRCESSRLTNSSTEELSEVLGLLDEGGGTDEDAGSWGEEERRRGGEEERASVRFEFAFTSRFEVPREKGQIESVLKRQTHDPMGAPRPLDMQSEIESKGSQRVFIVAGRVSRVAPSSAATFHILTRRERVEE